MDVADRVFGVETRDTPTPRWIGFAKDPHLWHHHFDGPKPEWYIEPGSEREYVAPRVIELADGTRVAIGPDASLSSILAATHAP